MKTRIFQFHNNEWQPYGSGQLTDPARAQLLICFGAKTRLTDPGIYPSARAAFPNADICFCSTAGEIMQDHVQDHSLVAAALQSCQHERRLIDIARLAAASLEA